MGRLFVERCVRVLWWCYLCRHHEKGMVHEFAAPCVVGCCWRRSGTVWGCSETAWGGCGGRCFLHVGEMVSSGHAAHTLPSPLRTLPSRPLPQRPYASRPLPLDRTQAEHYDEMVEYTRTHEIV